MFDEESESRLNSGGMILELQETDSIKLDFDLEPLTTCVSIQSKSTSRSSLSASTSGQEILLRAAASTLLNPHLYLIVMLYFDSREQNLA